MDVQVNIPAWEMAAIQITYDESKDLLAKKEELMIDNYIESEAQKLTLKGAADSSIKFEIKDKVSGDIEEITFSLKWWTSYVSFYPQPHQHSYNRNWDHEQNSGDYIFRPLTGQYESLAYSDLDHYTSSGN